MQRLLTDSRILILGHRGLVGSALSRKMRILGLNSALTAGRAEVDLRDQAATLRWIGSVQPQFVIVAAAKVGGIVANSRYPYDFIYENLMIAANVIEACRLVQVEKILMLGSTCIYPRLAPQPIREDSLLTGPLESTNEWYAVAKIAGIKLGQAVRRQHGLNVISAMPTNLYGPNDNFDLENSHVLPAMIRKFHDAVVSGSDRVIVWGSGTPRREFLHVDDLADALLLLLDRYDDEAVVNVGCGKDISIAELAVLVGQIVGFTGEIVYDSSKPDGTPRKQTDVSKLQAHGWVPKIKLKEGIEQAYAWYLGQLALQSR